MGRGEEEDETPLSAFIIFFAQAERKKKLFLNLIKCVHFHDSSHIFLFHMMREKFGLHTLDLVLIKKQFISNGYN